MCAVESVFVVCVCVCLEEQGKRKGRKGMVGADFHLKLGSSFSSSQLDSNW